MTYQDIYKIYKSKRLKEEKIKYKEQVIDGLENAPNAFIGLLEGENFGKLVIKVAEPLSF